MQRILKKAIWAIFLIKLISLSYIKYYKIDRLVDLLKKESKTLY